MDRLLDHFWEGSALLTSSATNPRCFISRPSTLTSGFGQHGVRPVCDVALVVTEDKYGPPNALSCVDHNEASAKRLSASSQAGTTPSNPGGLPWFRTTTLAGRRRLDWLLSLVMFNSRGSCGRSVSCELPRCLSTCCTKAFSFRICTFAWARNVTLAWWLAAILSVLIFTLAFSKSTAAVGRSFNISLLQNRTWVIVWAVRVTLCRLSEPRKQVSPQT
mmetsp:Transcript_44014/g.116390  ORF Transcript_44014/g.116390 Transcript_44014/m.116390 type:complete len:218 (+) Transcript_44014:591-1244(+)